MMKFKVQINYLDFSKQEKSYEGIVQATTPMEAEDKVYRSIPNARNLVGSTVSKIN